MKNRRVSALGIASCLSLPLLATGCAEFQHNCSIDTQRNCTWPQPFRGADAAAAMAPFEVMKNNGWRSYNTLPTALFTEDHRLTEAGRLRVKWIVTQAPVERRAIFVLNGNDSRATAARVESVQLAVSELLPVGALPQIYVTDVEPVGSSGQYQTKINRALMSSTPLPRLPRFTGLNTPGQVQTAPNSGGGGGSGGSSSGSR